jgi:hypothetical protein
VNLPKSGGVGRSGGMAQMQQSSFPIMGASPFDEWPLMVVHIDWSFQSLPFWLRFALEACFEACKASNLPWLRFRSALASLFPRLRSLASLMRACKARTRLKARACAGFASLAALRALSLAGQARGLWEPRRPRSPGLRPARPEACRGLEASILRPREASRPRFEASRPRGLEACWGLEASDLRPRGLSLRPEASRPRGLDLRPGLEASTWGLEASKPEASWGLVRPWASRPREASSEACKPGLSRPRSEACLGLEAFGA